MKLKIDWQKPKTELDHVVLTMLVWYDIWKHGYTIKYDSKYWAYIKNKVGTCPLCAYYFVCKKCFLPQCLKADNNPYGKWYEWDDKKGAKRIYLLCKQKAKELINEYKEYYNPRND